jgi:hypothetical protein
MPATIVSEHTMKRRFPLLNIAASPFVGERRVLLSSEVVPCSRRPPPGGSLGSRVRGAFARELCATRARTSHERLLQHVHARLERHVVGIAAIEVSEPRPLPHDVRSDPRSRDVDAVAPAVPGWPSLAVRGDVRDEPVAEGAVRVPCDEAVLAPPALAVCRVERVDVDDAAIAVERLSGGTGCESEDGGATIGQTAEEVMPRYSPHTLRSDFQTALPCERQPPE